MLPRFVCSYVFFNCYYCYLTATANSGPLSRGSLTHPMLITAFLTILTQRFRVHSFLQSKGILSYLSVKLLSMDIFTVDFIITIGLLVCWSCVFPLTVKPLYSRQHWDLKIMSIIESCPLNRGVAL